MSTTGTEEHRPSPAAGPWPVGFEPTASFPRLLVALSLDPAVFWCYKANLLV